MPKPVLAAVALVVVAAGAAWYVSTRGDAPNAAPSTAVINVTPEELAEMLQNEDPEMVNVHVPYEGELPKTDAFIPYDRIDERLADLPAKDEKIVLYCRSGRMSAVAADVLVEAGYTNVFQLSGGFEAWEEAGYRLIVR